MICKEEINGKDFGEPPGSIVRVRGEVQKCKIWMPVSYRKNVLLDHKKLVWVS